MKALIVSSMVFCSALSSAHASPTERLVAHEWGTFTSIQGAQGVQEKWNGVNPAELPKFVHGLLWPDGREGKIAPLKLSFFAAQRMETPVIYFYSDEPRKVDVSVDFPHGTITEWFPQAT